MRRRAYLGSVVAATVGSAGCLDSPRSRAVRPAEDPWRDVEAESEDHALWISGRAVLPPNTFAARTLDVDRTLDFEGEFLSDPSPIDFLVLSPEQFERFEAGDSFDYLGGSRFDTSKAYVIRQLGPGEYRIVFDNSNHGRAEAKDATSVEFTILGEAGTGSDE